MVVWCGFVGLSTDFRGVFSRVMSGQARGLALPCCAEMIVAARVAGGMVFIEAKLKRIDIKFDTRKDPDQWAAHM